MLARTGPEMSQHNWQQSTMRGAVAPASTALGGPPAIVAAVVQAAPNFVDRQIVGQGHGGHWVIHRQHPLPLPDLAGAEGEVVDCGGLVQRQLVGKGRGGGVAAAVGLQRGVGGGSWVPTWIRLNGRQEHPARQWRGVTATDLSCPALPCRTLSSSTEGCASSQWVKVAEP